MRTAGFIAFGVAIHQVAAHVRTSHMHTSPLCSLLTPHRVAGPTPSLFHALPIPIINVAKTSSRVSTGVSRRMSTSMVVSASQASPTPTPSIPRGTSLPEPLGFKWVEISIFPGQLFLTCFRINASKDLSPRTPLPLLKSLVTLGNRFPLMSFKWLPLKT